jgi:hypothetical protein
MARNDQRSTTFGYSPRHRWAYLPTALFLAVVFAILAIDPSLVWSDLDPRTREAALILAGALAVGFAVALIDRWLSPFWFSCEPDALVARPLLGAARRVPWTDVTAVNERPKSFFRGTPELEVRFGTGRTRPLVVRHDLTGYDRFEKLLRRHLPAEVQARWKEARREERRNAT